MGPAALCGLVLAGGESRRMGRDKGRLLWEGTEQRLRAAQLLARVCSDVFLSLRAAEEVPGYHVLPDLHPGIGPISGLLSAFAHRPGAAWLLLACDLPLMNEAALRLLLAQRDPGALATCFAHDDGTLEPLAAIWEPAAGPLLQSACADGKYGLQALLSQGNVQRLAIPSAEWLRNTNTPGEWEEALALAHRPEHP